jgi:hypothetical protein
MVHFFAPFIVEKDDKNHSCRPHFKLISTFRKLLID